MKKNRKEKNKTNKKKSYKKNNMNKKMIAFTIILFLILFLNSCSQNNTNFKTKNTTNFTKNITKNNNTTIKNITNNTIKNEEKDEKNTTNITDKKIIKSIKLIPSKEKIYLGAFMDFNNSENIVTKEKIEYYNTIANFSYSYFSNNWNEKIEYPEKNIHIIISQQKIPFLRIMPNRKDKKIIQKINSGIYDKNITLWFKKAKEDYENTKIPLLIDFAVEMNGDWFGWSFNPEEYKKAYERIIRIAEEQNVTHITWFFHTDINTYTYNPIEYYTKKVDWIGTSIYGPQSQIEDYESFSELYEKNKQKVLVDEKPFGILELGIHEGKWDDKNKTTWIKDAFETIFNSKEIKIVCLWSEDWITEEDNKIIFSDLKINSSKESLKEYKKYLQNKKFTDNMLFKITYTDNTTRIITQKELFNNTNKTIKKNSYKKKVLFKPKETWQWQLEGKINYSYNVSIYDLDLFKVTKEEIKKLHEKGIKVICYFSAGTYEDYRNDSKLFSKELLGKTLEEWEDEKWLDIRKIELLKPIITERMNLALEKDCDAVEVDNIDAYQNPTGFKITYEDQIKYNKYLSEEAHKRNLSIALKNDLEQIKDLVDYYDLAINEQCFEYNECELLFPFIKQDKAVLGVEYNLELKDFCKKAIEYNFSWLKMDYSLNGTRKSCEEYLNLK